MRHSLRFLWNATKGHRLAPWRSPYLLWRIETYCGVKMTQIGFLEFWEFLWRERTSLWRFLKWTGEMERYAHPKPKNLSNVVMVPFDDYTTTVILRGAVFGVAKSPP